jgi:hypothetical protein
MKHIQRKCGVSFLILEQMISAFPAMLAISLSNIAFITMSECDNSMNTSPSLIFSIPLSSSLVKAFN